MKALLKLNEIVGKIEGFFLCFFLMTMVILAFVQVVARNVFNEGIPWADTVVRLMVLWVGFLGACLATKLDQHLTMEVLTKYMSERVKHASAVIVKIFAIAVCCLLFLASLKFLKNEASSNEQFLHLFPLWWAESIIPITFVLIPFHLLFTIARDARLCLKGKAE
jgi:TRAP-type C4-dicarboxylate transport system permease small subunit